ncbi:FRG domain-containing protein [Leptospira adleri]|uniref:FRG domain-containing protein n=1 Tax=Leptospira adleri TaxID=2023186 RepID=A0ABX4NX65_9LEPT|nr:FRG domain-containing protein [Leptospira adleri]PJZ59658.1 hypothetical protein CH376_22605 [Leptospira adleri]
MKIVKYEFEELQNVLDFIRAIAITKKSYIFRGIPKEKFSLTTTIERDYDLTDLEKYGYGLDEAGTLEKFYKTSYHYDSEWKFNPESILEIWSLIQHYGGRTRLLDFTHSFPVALYFSYWKLEEDFNPAIWCLSNNEITDKLKQLASGLLDKSKEFENFTKFENRFTNTLWRKEDLLRAYKKENNLLNLILHYSMGSLWGSHKPDIPNLMIPIEPPRKNQRLIMQNGCFLMPTNSRTSSLNNLLGMFSENDSDKLNLEIVLKKPNYANFVEALEGNTKILINLKKIKVQQCTYLLGGMNVRGETLFPDFQGLIASVSRYGRIPKELL